MSRKQTRLKKQLQNILQTQPNSLQAEVAREALEYGGDIENFFTDLLTHGCQSGMIRGLIYYHDTHQFYDTYYDEIETLREELEESVGILLHPKSDLKNWYAWMAFEETARSLIDDFKLF